MCLLVSGCVCPGVGSVLMFRAGVVLLMFRDDVDVGCYCYILYLHFTVAKQVFVKKFYLKIIRKIEANRLNRGFF